MSRDRKKTVNLCIDKNESTTSVYIDIASAGSTLRKKLFDKSNVFWYDCVYLLARHGKWFDSYRFGIGYNKGKIDVWYSI